jgi:hypothetical protein
VYDGVVDDWPCFPQSDSSKTPLFALNLLPSGNLSYAVQIERARRETKRRAMHERIEPTTSVAGSAIGHPIPSYVVRFGGRRLRYLVLPDGSIVFPSSLPGPSWVGLAKWLVGLSFAGLVASITSSAAWYLIALPATTLGLGLVLAVWYLLLGAIWSDPP